MKLAQFKLTYKLLHTLLNLPDDTRIQHVGNSCDPFRQVFTVVVSGTDFPEVSEMAPPYPVDPSFTRHFGADGSLIKVVFNGWNML